MFQDIIWDYNIPGFYGRAQHVTKFVVNPCDAPWTVYAETALPALGYMALALVDTSLTDLLRAYARPRSALGRDHRRKKGRNRRRSRGIPDITELIARRLPYAQLVAARQVSTPIKHFWRIDGAIQRGLWYWLLVDVVADGAFIWTSLIEESRYCQAERRRGFLATGDDWGTNIPLHGWMSAGPLYPEYEANGAVWTSYAAHLPEGVWHLIFAGMIGGGAEAMRGYEMRWIDQDRPDQVLARSELIDTDPGKTRPINLSLDVLGPRNVLLQDRVASGMSNGSDGLLIGTLQSKRPAP